MDDKSRSALLDDTLAEPQRIVDGAPAAGPARLMSSIHSMPATLPEPPASPGEGIDSAGQSGDTVGLSRNEFSSESVEDLTEEGQAYEAAFLAGVEQAAEAGDAGVPRLRRKEEAP